jgi:hypothetical protein
MPGVQWAGSTCRPGCLMFCCCWPDDLLACVRVCMCVTSHPVSRALTPHPFCSPYQLVCRLPPGPWLLLVARRLCGDSAAAVRAFLGGVVILSLVTHGPFRSHCLSPPPALHVSRVPSTLLHCPQQLHTVLCCIPPPPLFLYACDVCSFSDSQQPVCRAFCGVCLVGRRHVPIYTRRVLPQGAAPGTTRWF